MLRKSTNWLFGAVALGICIMATGCCGPIGCGVGCGLPGDSCQDCDCYSPERPIAHGPIDAFRLWKRSLVCGGGCGEVYYGEWMSTPPDACDPCCGDQFVGGATKCRPFCWQPGALLGNFYGQRFCEGGVECGCGDEGCGEVGYDEFGCDSCGGAIDSVGGCATCDAGSLAGGTTRIAHQRGARVNTPTQHQIMAQQQMQRTARRMQSSQRSSQPVRR